MWDLLRRGKENRRLLARCPCVDPLGVVVHEPLDLALALEVLDGGAGNGAIDLQTVDEGRLADHLESGDLLQDAVVQWPVEDDGVLCLVLNLALGPLLLLVRLGRRSENGSLLGRHCGRVKDHAREEARMGESRSVHVPWTGRWTSEVRRRQRQ